MTQEEKQLLLADLCARLPYGVIVKDRNATHALSVGNTEFADLFSGKCNIKPYLRPMSSMTEDEKEKYHELCDSYYGIYFDSIDSIDWLLKNHVDYRCLIPKGLAIAVTKDNNPYKE